MSDYESYNIENIMFIDFKDLNKRNGFCLQIKDILSEDINTQKIKRFVKAFSKYAEDKVKEEKVFSKDFEEEYCDIIKTGLKTLRQYAFLRAIGKEDIFLMLHNISTENDYIKDTLLYFHKHIKKSIDAEFKTLFERFTFFESKRPFLHKLRTKDAEFDDYRINNVKLIITFPCADKFLDNDQIVRKIYFHTINWALNPKHTAYISMFGNKSYLKLANLCDLLWVHDQSEKYKFPDCKLWYNGQQIILNKKKMHCKVLNSKAKLYCSKNGFIAEIKDLNKEILSSSSCPFSNLTIEIDCDMEYSVWPHIL